MIEFSVLMSVYLKDNPIWLKEALESMVNQTKKASEILIVQDGPITKELNDVLNDYMRQYPFIRTHQLTTNQGLGLALKEGILQCKYDYIARMDADDISIPERFEKQVAYFENHFVDAVGSVIIEFEDDPYTSTILRQLPETHDAIVKFSKKRNPIGHSSMMFKKKAVLNAGNYRDFYLVEDYDLWIRMIQTGSKFYNFQTPITYMRISKDFYKRRGGIKYYLSIHRFKKLMYRQKHITYWQYLKTNLASLVVCMLPGFVRSFIYKKLLRKQVKKD